MDRLLHEPHHDGSPLYLMQEAASLGADVPVRVRTSRERQPTAVWLRTREDGAARYLECSISRVTDTEVWWSGVVQVTAPVQRYRFLIVEGETTRWLNQAGLAEHAVTDADDFSIQIADSTPEWARDGVVYHVIPDRFARSAAADSRPIAPWAIPAQWDELPSTDPEIAALQAWGGDLDGLADQLGHIVDLGASVVSVTSTFPAPSSLRADPASYADVDPLLGGEDAAARVIETAAAAGLRVVGELPINQTSVDHPWYLAHLRNPDGREGDFYLPNAEPGSPTARLDHRSTQLQWRVREIVERGISSGLAGWRVPGAAQLGRHGADDVAADVVADLARTARGVSPDAVVVGDHDGDATVDIAHGNWHATVDLDSFTRPVWEWLRDPRWPIPHTGLPVGLPRRGGHAFADAINSMIASYGWRNYASGWHPLSTPQTPRIRSVVGSAESHHAAAVLQFTLPGVPVIFAGDELGLEGDTPAAACQPMPPRPWRGPTADLYRDLIRLRAEHPALRRGSLRWSFLSDDIIAFVREHPVESLLVTVARSTWTTDPNLSDGKVLLETGEAGTARARIQQF